MPSTLQLRATVLAAVLAAVGLVLPVGRASAQDAALAVEVRGGASVPMGDFADGTASGEGAEPGVSFGVDFALAGGGRWTTYVGFSQHRFGCEDAGCASGGEYVATGFHAGTRFVPMPGWSVLPWLGGGVVTTHVEADDLGPADAGLSNLGIGWEVAFGVHIGSASPVALSPSVRWVSVRPELPSGTDLGMRYLVADVGVVLAF